MKKILIIAILSLFVISFVFAEGTSSGGGSGGGGGAKIFHIDDTFKVGWTDGTDNYGAELKVWKIDEAADGNKTSLLLMPTGIIAASNIKEGDKYLLGHNAKINFKQIYVSGDDKWIALTLENAEFKESTLPSSPSPGSGGGGGQGGGCYDTDGGKDYYEKGIAAGIWDSCISKYKLSERYCTSNNEGSDYIKECPIGYLCEDGACVESDEDDRVETPTSTGGSGGGGGSCPQYYTCPDGTQVEYCERVRTEIPSTCTGSPPVCTSGSVSIKCECVENPSSLCTTPSEGGGGGGGEPIVDLDECKSNQECNDDNPCTDDLCSGTPKKCTNERKNGCIVNDKCVAQGTVYELKDKRYFCGIPNKGQIQKEDGKECNNAYECESNICERNQCGRYCEGCKDENKNCIPFGTRLENKKYCDVDKSIKDQKSEEDSCNNNYECTSNVCVNSKCIEPGFIQKIINWFKRLFG